MPPAMIIPPTIIKMPTVKYSHKELLSLEVPCSSFSLGSLDGDKETLALSLTLGAVDADIDTVGDGVEVPL